MRVKVGNKTLRFRRRSAKRIVLKLFRFIKEKKTAQRF